jgi:hypothetical protein
MALELVFGYRDRRGATTAATSRATRSPGGRRESADTPARRYLIAARKEVLEVRRGVPGSVQTSSGSSRNGFVVQAA